MAASREESLRELLTRVHERLSGAATVDSESRRLLATLTQDIERALGSQTAATAVAQSGAAQSGGTNKRRVRRESVSTLEGLAARFDAEHPALAQTLRQLVDFLGKGGV